MASRPLPHTLGHSNCPACEAERCEALRAANSADLPFAEAARLWLLNTREDVADKTHSDHQAFIGRLNRFFGPMILRTIHIGNLKSYQKARQGKSDNPADNLGKAGPELINHEISVLSRVLDAAGLWKPIKPYYKCMKVPKYGPGRALSDEERDRLIMVASSNPRWRVAYLCTLLTLNLTRGAGEIRKVKVREIDLRNRNLRIEEGAKNEYREVDFPMTDTVHWCAGQLLKRYHKLCDKYGVTPSPDHYVLPARRKHGYGYDFYKPMGSWRSAWDSLIEKAELTGFRIYDLRHDASTKKMEDELAADTVVEQIMGHVTKRQKLRYRHLHRDPVLEALERTEVRPAPRIIETVDGFVEIPVIGAKRRGSEVPK